MNRLLLCEPNVSEGRDRARMDRFAGAVTGTPGVELLHRSADPDHHRMVLAYRGAPDAVLAATKALAERVFEEIDLASHRGVHPRLGALDVVPFVPLRAGGEVAALETCRAFGTWVGERGVPVFYYERAATRPERRALPHVRREGFETLAARLLEPAWAPDEGPPEAHPRLGAVITGVRGPLVRFNVNLGYADPTVARAVARAIRESSGGLPSVRALGLALPARGLSQVSMNLTDYRRTTMARAYERVRREAERHGAPVAGTEVIGPVPEDALAGLPDEVRAAIAPDQILRFEDAP